MDTNKEALEKDKNSNNKPVQEDKPSGEQRPMGSESDIKKHDRDIEERAEDDGDTNRVGIRRD